MLKHVTMFCMLLIISLACSKKQFDETPAASTTPQQLGACDCVETTIEYIKASFNNFPICFNTSTGATDTFSNAYYYNTATHLDHISIVRENRTKTMTCQVNLVNTDLHNKTLPYTIAPSANPNEYAEIELSNINSAWNEKGSDDYISNTYNFLSITITDTTGGYLRGNFSGQADTKSGKRISIKNGIFLMHIIDVKK